jgi:hypothetical protein
MRDKSFPDQFSWGLFGLVGCEKFGIDEQEESYRLLDNLRRLYLQ